ncbi:Beta-1,3-galactosyltransferase GALT1 [Sesamum angolense]|uniref:Beta-1,3-galactosyltransferase GALT1 n=1 Tax=Sesamum angolense TaxID=2727404 RepID=A0AAE2BZE0_9LAMI|nr:Beta-1,3-galactosyltransferase GALT1 [Sesamum angolense]
MWNAFGSVELLLSVGECGVSAGGVNVDVCFGEWMYVAGLEFLREISSVVPKPMLHLVICCKLAFFVGLLCGSELVFCYIVERLKDTIFYVFPLVLLEFNYHEIESSELQWDKSSGVDKCGCSTCTFQSTKYTSSVSAEAIVAEFFTPRNLSKEEQSSLQTWNRLKHLVTHAQGLPNAVEAIKEAGAAWKNLITSVDEEKLQSNGSLPKRGKEKQCPHFLSKMNASELGDNGFKLRVPCGLTQGEPDPPIILHYNVRLHGDKITEDPVIVQNTWTIAHDWGEEERCPSPDQEKKKKGYGFLLLYTSLNHVYFSSDQLLSVAACFGLCYLLISVDELDQCNELVESVSEGIQMTVDGKHITSFAFREALEPWLVSEVRISGDINLISVVASGLPTSEDLEHIIDLEALKAVPLPHQRPLNLFIGIFSTANNFKRRMAVRRSWMQYPEVRSGEHKNQMVNEELWNEARTYGDIQLMPFVDYYSLITWKTIAICIFGTEVVSAKFIMKTDDDAFVRVDEILNSLRRTNVTHGLLYGLINSDSEPHRSPDSKWYISPEEWPDDKYPPWAHGPGYVVSRDIAKTISKKHRKGQLKIFKLEDVAMGIWIADMQKKGLEVRYEKDERIFNDGCKDGYVVAHYQGPRELLCLWQKIQETKRAFCCGE